MNSNDLDPIFNLPRPAFFAHRGGAGEAPESTIDSFLYGLHSGANIIEVDIQLSKDNVPVVWHGPELEIAFDEDGEFMTRHFISCWEWKDLNKLRVRRPQAGGSDCVEQGVDSRWIVSMSQLVDFVVAVKDGEYGEDLRERPVHLNLELKKTTEVAFCDCSPGWMVEKVAGEAALYPNLNRVLEILDRAPEEVTIVVGSVNQKIISRFRQLQEDRCGKRKYTTNLSIIEQLPYAGLFETSNIKGIGKFEPVVRFALILIGAGARIFIGRKKNLAEYAFETPASIVSPKLVQEVHGKKGGIYLFLSPFPALDQPEEDRCRVESDEYRQRIKSLVDMGVDGLMSDYPCALRGVLKDIEAAG